jgi:hypothetical protein
MVMVTPAICFCLGIILVNTRKYTRFTRLVWGALLAALLPVGLGTLLAVWAAKVLFSMVGGGI